ncbi:hypothetical protein ACH4T9_15695 [Micromonospora sp. NPDC020750]|uniref:immunity protein Imm33 domain-containing protein n=1 Tax=unclassified Micromonospora TaxID=2617518 RepID=UPI0037A9E6F2
MTPAAGSAPGRAPLREFSRRIGSATVTVEAREQLGTQADALLDIIAAYADELRDKFSVQAGWAPFMLVARGEDRFGVVAPDFATETPDQVGWVGDLTLALWVLNGQVTVARRLPGAEPQPVHFNDTVLCWRGIENAERLIMSRTARKDRADDSGWYIDVFPQPRESRQANEFVRWPAFQLLGVNKHIARALLLPVGYGAVVSPTRIDAIIDLSAGSVAVPGPL